MNENINACIYLIDKTELTYKGREHIIPAALGGKSTLPRGAVSDQINQLFSQREKVAMHETFLALNRNQHGPGKRGSSFVWKVKNPKVELLEVQSYQSESNELDIIYAPYRLGFLFYGIAHMIPQILFPIESDWSFKMPRIVMGTIEQDAINSTATFLNAFEAFRNQQKKIPQQDYKVIRSNLKITDGFFILGFYNKVWFLYTSLPDNYIPKFYKLITLKPLPKNTPIFPSTKAIYQYSHDLPRALDESFIFLYIKTGFNVLAFMMGLNFIRENQFNSIRKAIISGKGLSEYTVEKTMPKWIIKWVNENVESKSHFVILHGYNNLIEAYVSFYREPLYHAICISHNYTGEAFKKFFICNYIKQFEKHGDIK